MKKMSLGFLLLVGPWPGAMGCASSPSPTEAVCPPSAPSFGSSGVQAKSGSESNPKAEDPVVTDGDKYHVILENSEVRVLSYHDQPGDKTHPHYHRKFVLYALSPFRRRLSFPDGTVKERDFVRGDIIWMPEQVHVGENIGTTDTDVIIVEIKGVVPDGMSGSASPDLP